MSSSSETSRPDEHAVELLRCLKPDIGGWNQATSFREPEVARLLLLAHLRNWGGTEKAGQLHAFVGESLLSASLHFALDLALLQFIRTRTAQPDFAGALRAL